MLLLAAWGRASVDRSRAGTAGRWLPPPIPCDIPHMGDIRGGFRPALGWLRIRSVPTEAVDRDAESGPCYPQLSLRPEY